MKILSKNIRIWLCDFSELALEEQNLLRLAAKVRQNARAPETHVWVGTALMSESGKVYSGCNIERRSLSETSHAEVTAINVMVASEGEAKLKTVALVIGPEHHHIVMPPEKTGRPTKNIEEITEVPCGKCLHIIWEHSRSDKTKIITILGNGEVASSTIGDLLPIRFTKKAPCS